MRWRTSRRAVWRQARGTGSKASCVGRSATPMASTTTSTCTRSSPTRSPADATCEVSSARRTSDADQRAELLGPGDRALLGRGVELGNDLDLADDVRVQLVKILSRNPVLQDRLPADLLDLVPIQERLSYLESGHVSRAACLDVPVASDLRRVFLVENGIE